MAVDTLISIDELAALFPADRGFVYLATPYKKWAHGEDHACFVASDLAGRLVLKGLCIFSPVAHFHVIAKTVMIDPHDALWFKLDKPFADAAQALLIADLQGWRDSRGIEREYAWFNFTPRYLINPETLESRPLRGAWGAET